MAGEKSPQYYTHWDERGRCPYVGHCEHGWAALAKAHPELWLVLRGREKVRAGERLPKVSATKGIGLQAIFYFEIK